MKNRKLLLITIALITVASVLLTGSLALMTTVADEENPLPAASAVPDVSGAELETPETEKLSDYAAVYEIDGKKTVKIFSEEQLRALEERRANGEWLTLSADEMVAIVEETVAFFYDSHAIQVGTLENGTYSAKVYNGYLHYTSDEYTKLSKNEAPHAEQDVFDIILTRITTLNDAVGSRDTTSYDGLDNPDLYYAFADMPYTDDETLMHYTHSQGHTYTYDGSWQETKYDCLRLYVYESGIQVIRHNTSTISEEECKPYESTCHTTTKLFYDEQFEKDFVTTEELAETRRIRVEIYEEATQELVNTFTLTDAEFVNTVYNNFLTAFDKACKEFETYNNDAEEASVRTKYRVAVFLESTCENLTTTGTKTIDISYPYGYNNDFYTVVHPGLLFNDYHINGGSSFIEMIDEYVDPYIPAE